MILFQLCRRLTQKKTALRTLHSHTNLYGPLTATRDGDLLLIQALLIFAKCWGVCLSEGTILKTWSSQCWSSKCAAPCHNFSAAFPPPLPAFLIIFPALTAALLWKPCQSAGPHQACYLDLFSLHAALENDCYPLQLAWKPREAVGFKGEFRQ